MFIRFFEILADGETKKQKSNNNVPIYCKITKLFSSENRQAADWRKKVGITDN